MIGAVNGILIGYFRLTPFITTMATQLIARGIAFVLSQGIAVKGTPFWMLDFGFMTWFGIPAVTVVALVSVLLAMVSMSQTTWGRHVMLVGSNRHAARYSGINVRFIDFSVYLVCRSRLRDLRASSRLPIWAMQSRVLATRFC